MKEPLAPWGTSAVCSDLAQHLARHLAQGRCSAKAPRQQLVGNSTGLSAAQTRLSFQTPNGGACVAQLVKRRALDLRYGLNVRVLSSSPAGRGAYLENSRGVRTREGHREDRGSTPGARRGSQDHSGSSGRTSGALQELRAPEGALRELGEEEPFLPGAHQPGSPQLCSVPGTEDPRPHPTAPQSPAHDPGGRPRQGRAPRPRGRDPPQQVLACQNLGGGRRPRPGAPDRRTHLSAARRGSRQLLRGLLCSAGGCGGGVGGGRLHGNGPPQGAGELRAARTPAPAVVRSARPGAGAVRPGPGRRGPAWSGCLGGPDRARGGRSGCGPNRLQFGWAVGRKKAVCPLKSGFPAAACGAERWHTRPAARERH